MNFSGEYRIEAPREEVWRALNDPEVLRQAIPGCEAIEKESETAFTARVKTRIGPVSAAFKGRVSLSDLDPPKGYTISGEGQGGVAGFAKGGARVTLEEAGPGATLLRYAAEGQVGGKLAQIGARLVEGSAKKIADEFFGRFNELVGRPAAAPAEAAPAAVSAPAAPAPVSAPGPGLSSLWFALAWLALVGLFVLGVAQ